MKHISETTKRKQSEVLILFIKKQGREGVDAVAGGGGGGTEAGGGRNLIHSD